MIAELLPIATGVAGAALGFLVRRRATRTGPVKPVCPCEHVISVHEEMTGACTGEIRRKRYYKSGERGGWEYVPCPCLHYAGPELISAYTYREIATEKRP